jgi:hypothetical protein
MCTSMQGEIFITQQGQKIANVGRLLSISPSGLFYIVAICSVLIYGP